MPDESLNDQIYKGLVSNGCSHELAVWLLKTHNDLVLLRAELRVIGETLEKLKREVTKRA